MENTNQANVGCLNTIVHTTSNNNIWATHVASSFASTCFLWIATICTLLLSFIFSYAFHLLLIHFLVILCQDYDIEFISKKGSSLEHIRERIVEFLVTQVMDPKGEFHFGWTLRLRTLC
jgi:hypothetical protein